MTSLSPMPDWKSSYLHRYKSTPAWVAEAKRLWVCGLPMRDVAKRMRKATTTVRVYQQRDRWERPREAHRGRPSRRPRQRPISPAGELFHDCGSCGLPRPASEYRQRVSRGVTMPDYRCRDCLRRKRQIERERARAMSDGTLTPAALSRLYRSSHACPYCDVQLTRDTRTLDHIVPLARGGIHGLNNVLVCCADCNRRKSDKLLADWLAEIGKS